jgi:hypothetical protein
MIAQTFRAEHDDSPAAQNNRFGDRRPRSLSLEFIADRAKQRREAPDLLVSPWRFRVHPV